MNYSELFRLLFESNVRYLICGGLAMNIYGIPRMTVDIDLLIDFEKNNIRAFKKVLKQLQYLPRIPVDLAELENEETRVNLMEEKSLIAYSYYNQKSNYLQLDVLLEAPLSFEEMWKNKTERKINHFSLYLVSVEHLITMKEYANRIQDKNDIILLSKFKGS